MPDELTFRQAIELFLTNQRRFAKIEQRPWGAEGAMIEMIKQVGELAKHVMVAERYYFAGREEMWGYVTNKEIIGDELADVFSMVIRLADHYGIDLVEAHLRARQMEDEYLKSLGV
jgi:NTP pyrophosphatase (non-canonical NTP hydrolase)